MANNVKDFLKIPNTNPYVEEGRNISDKIPLNEAGITRTVLLIVWVFDRMLVVEMRTWKAKYIIQG